MRIAGGGAKSPAARRAQGGGDKEQDHLPNQKLLCQLRASVTDSGVAHQHSMSFQRAKEKEKNLWSVSEVKQHAYDNRPRQTHTFGFPSYISTTTTITTCDPPPIGS